jgi:hypothetical protein
MKKVIPYLCNLYNRWSNKRLIQLLALLLALAVPAPVLLGGDDDHDHNNDREHGRFVDPIVGSWIIHVTVDTFIGYTYVVDNTTSVGRISITPRCNCIRYTLVTVPLAGLGRTRSCSVATPQDRPDQIFLGWLCQPRWRAR